MKPHTCPVCRGKGLVSNGFYSQTPGAWTTSTLGHERCRTCDGTGIVWEPEDDNDEWQKLLKMDFINPKLKP